MLSTTTTQQPESVPHDDDYMGDPPNVDPVGSVDPYHKAPVPMDV
jgi:hypothetical protein